MTLRERLVASVADIRTRGQRLVQLNRELLAAELKEKGKKFGAAIALFAGAGLLSLYAIGFALTTIAVALALVLPLWLSLLIVTLALFLVVVILVLVGRLEGFLNLPHFDHLHRFLPALFKRAGYKLVNVSVNHRPRWHGVSKYGVMNRLFVGIHDLIGVRWLLKRSCAPEITGNE